jgi:hypothetical protein
MALICCSHSTGNTGNLAVAFSLPSSRSLFVQALSRQILFPSFSWFYGQKTIKQNVFLSSDGRNFEWEAKELEGGQPGRQGPTASTLGELLL